MGFGNKKTMMPSYSLQILCGVTTCVMFIYAFYMKLAGKVRSKPMLILGFIVIFLFCIIGLWNIIIEWRVDKWIRKK